MYVVFLTSHKILLPILIIVDTFFFTVFALSHSYLIILIQSKYNYTPSQLQLLLQNVTDTV